MRDTPGQLEAARSCFSCIQNCNKLKTKYPNTPYRHAVPGEGAKKGLPGTWTEAYDRFRWQIRQRGNSGELPRR